MPSKNILKNLAPNSYHHIYNRGVEKKDIFLEDEDKAYLLTLFDRYLNPNTIQIDSDNNPYVYMGGDVEMQSYCIMSNHFHFLFWVGSNPGNLPSLMRAVGTSYTKYYNSKHDRIGPLFQSRYKASPIQNEEQLLHLSRYVHLNPRNFLEYEYSSIKTFLGGEPQPWLKPKRVLNALNDDDYFKFLLSA